ncbi:adenosylcobinamide-phosphate synthase [Secundilactobacillus paracollinoides]|uniref:Cobalamin biosynthesis protein CobD n=1 Tax=Secundilactobacillus paracollinoides TaxID=240427 RepID=A0A1B2IYG8_9LACO|nr:adenosylcobinamide-phosphate synthase CbiB [Secundilactobacillus paracollinoides]ANZ61160.1 adenosylcobinamide-phosphate synthase [Secundilactobacillus paracollinoides]ANZ64446.1 adenosylcobinamide-phosphate synthase [Secundilactobacillus paracollinoides]ANZ67081.1 adenosylcobinamide-phosphate synthase [Secundilactobacillus paracollinoides]KRL76081.1 adenosylcobinamide-phosphate synthase [Secundilactobacillus paracollinoides DSM 15502 = JCM 11969]
MQVISMITIGFVLDLLLGDPPTWPHPVKLIGHAIAGLTRLWNKPAYKPRTRRWLGGLMWVIIVGGTYAITFGLLWLTRSIPWLHFVIGTYLCYTCLSIKGLAIESRKIMASLRENNLKQARYQVGMIVGRDTDRLSAEDVCKATIETDAENTSDGVIAPLLYLAVGGPALGLAYKAVNTLDSMVGYQNETYGDIGLASAKLDDLFNYIPARLTWCLLMLATALLRFDTSNALVVGRRDREHHRSPNSGFSESVVAGALNLRLGGPHTYFGELVDKPFIGNADAVAADFGAIQNTLKLVYTVAVLGLVLVCACRVAFLIIGGFMA